MYAVEKALLITEESVSWRNWLGNRKDALGLNQEPSERELACYVANSIRLALASNLATLECTL
jgi:hypothetical protein